MKYSLLVLLLALGFMSTSGCATVVSGTTADVAINSAPQNAAVTIRDPKGAVVARTVTPGKVTLKRGRSWLRPARYEAVFEKQGYESTVRPIETTFNPWAVGNIVIGGGLGIGIDAITGAMWKPKAKAVGTQLALADPYYQQMPQQPMPQQPVNRQGHPAVQTASAMVTDQEQRQFLR